MSAPPAAVEVELSDKTPITAPPEDQEAAQLFKAQVAQAHPVKETLAAMAAVPSAPIEVAAVAANQPLALSELVAQATAEQAKPHQLPAHRSPTQAAAAVVVFQAKHLEAEALAAVVLDQATQPTQEQLEEQTLAVAAVAVRGLELRPAAVALEVKVS